MRASSKNSDTVRAIPYDPGYLISLGGKPARLDTTRGSPFDPGLPNKPGR